MKTNNRVLLGAALFAAIATAAGRPEAARGSEAVVARAIGASEAAGQDKPQDVAGVWALTVETAGGTGNPSVTIKQEGEKLSGTYSSQVFGEQPITGSIKGNAITFSFSGTFENTTFTVTYSGTVEKDTMTGKVTLGEMGDGTFTGKKK